MSEHVALFVDRLVASTATHGGDPPLSVVVGRASFSAKKAPSFNGNPKSSSSMLGKDEGGSNGNLINTEHASKPHPAVAMVAAAECRICQEEDDIINLESPCACTGSLKFAHRKCVQRWCNEKGDTVCEICRKPYKGGYMASASSAHADRFTINIGGSWEGEQLNLHESGLFSVASEHHFLDSDYEEYTRANARSAACFRAVACMLMVLLLLRHVSSMTTTVAEDDVLTFIMLFFLRAVGFFLPCYIMARALNMLHCRRQRQVKATCLTSSFSFNRTQDIQLPYTCTSMNAHFEHNVAKLDCANNGMVQEATLAVAEVAYLLQSGHSHAVLVTVSSYAP